MYIPPVRLSKILRAPVISAQSQTIQATKGNLDIINQIFNTAFTLCNSDRFSFQFPDIIGALPKQTGKIYILICTNLLQDSSDNANPTARHSPTIRPITLSLRIWVTPGNLLRPLH